jgi:hypothetical protein
MNAGFRRVETDTNETTYSPLDYIYSNYNGTQREYDLIEYNCQNFSRDFVLYAEEQGFYCETISGYNKETKSGHMWVRCDIEPQSLDFVNYNTEYPDQRVMQR